jgi:hypothetical protein
MIYNFEQFIKESLSDKYILKIEWEHGDADIDDKQSYKFNSKEELDKVLKFIYELRGPVKSSWKDYWHFDDGHNYREWSFVQKIIDKHGIEDIVPHDVKFSNYRPAVKKIWLKINGVKHHIVWSELLNKKENIIETPKIGQEYEITTGEVCGHWGQFKSYRKNLISYHDLIPYLGESKGDKTNYRNYPSFKVKAIETHIDENINLNYKPDFWRFNYVTLHEVIDERLGDLIGKYVTSSSYGFDPNHKPTYGNIKTYII